jgi:hypothetical protein
LIAETELVVQDFQTLASYPLHVLLNDSLSSIFQPKLESIQTGLSVVGWWLATVGYGPLHFRIPHATLTTLLTPVIAIVGNSDSKRIPAHSLMLSVDALKSRASECVDDLCLEVYVDTGSGNRQGVAATGKAGQRVIAGPSVGDSVQVLPFRLIPK